MTPLIRMTLRKLGRVGLVSILTILSSVFAYAFNFFLVKLLDFTYIPLEDLVLIVSITFVVTPLLSWYLIGLFFKIDSLEVQMTKLATTDSLTQVYNRGYFYRESKLALLDNPDLTNSYAEMPPQDNQNPAILVLDLDDLKKINDQFGHPGGDKVLIAFSAVLADLIKKPNLIGRLGGDEFVVFLKQTDAIELQDLIDRILEKVRACEVQIEGANYQFTVSIGVSFIDMENGKDLESAIKMADSALYDVKRLSRNGYAMHDERMAS